MSINKRPFLVSKTEVTPQDSLGRETTFHYLRTTSSAKKRTRATIKRVNQTLSLLHTYGSIIKEQEERGFIEKITDTAPNHNVHYILHHPVKKDSPTTPIRIVYDCSCKASPNQASLNECLQSGPPLLNYMTGILRFRTHHYGIVTDKEMAFLHLNLNTEDRDFTRFLLYGYQIRQTLIVPLTPIVLKLYNLEPKLSIHAKCNSLTSLGTFNSTVSLDMKRNMYVGNSGKYVRYW